MAEPNLPNQPSPLATATATFIIGITLGYLAGTGSSLGLWSSSSSSSKTPGKSQKSSWPNSYDVTVHPDSSDEELMAHLTSDGGKRAPVESDGDDSSDDDDEGPGGVLEEFKGNREECKLVLVVRNDLGMGKGKIAAQCSHATLACYNYFLKNAPNSTLLARWQNLGQAKVAVQCRSQEEMDELQAKALSLGLCARVIHDAGRTQIAAGSATVLGIGPGPKSVLDTVTGHLKLL